MKLTLIAGTCLAAGYSTISVASNSANCEVRFDANWSITTHPEGFPSNRFPHFSPLIGATHSAAASFWNPGDLASPGVQAVAETGATGTFSGELSASAEQLLNGPGIGSSDNTTIRFNATENSPLVTLITMIAPSPDWFIGVSGFDLRVGDDWVEEARVDLLPWDAGTDSGASYTAADLATMPPQPIAQIDGGGVGNGVPLGAFTFRCEAAPVTARVHDDGFEN